MMPRSIDLSLPDEVTYLQNIEHVCHIRQMSFMADQITAVQTARNKLERANMLLFNQVNINRLGGCVQKYVLTLRNFGPARLVSVNKYTTSERRKSCYFEKFSLKLRASIIEDISSTCLNHVMLCVT